MKPSRAAITACALLLLAGCTAPTAAVPPSGAAPSQQSAPSSPTTPTAVVCDYGPGAVYRVVSAWELVAASRGAGDHSDMIDSLADSIETAQGYQEDGCVGVVGLATLNMELSFLAARVLINDGGSAEDEAYESVVDAGNAWLDAIGDSENRFSDAPEAPAFEPQPEDFKVGIKVLEKQCFGSAGCNVTFRIKPEYVGSQSLPDGLIEVTYEVRGGDDPLINTFTIEGGTASYDSEERIGTPKSSSKLKAVVTEVSS